MKKIYSAAAVFFLCLFTNVGIVYSTAEAMAVTVNFSGTINTNYTSPGIFSVPTSFSGQVTYDPTTVPGVTLPTLAEYKYAAGEGLTGSIIIGSSNYVFDGGLIHVLNNHSLGDQFFLRVPNEGLMTGTPSLVNVDFLLRDTTSGMFSSTALPTANFFSQVDTKFVTFQDSFSAEKQIDGGSLEAWSFQLNTMPVPEPGTLALFGLGLAGLGIARRRKAA